MKSIITQILIIIGIIIVVNILADQFYFRLDFTADKRYTLSQASKDILSSLDEPVTVTAYFTEDVPSELIKVRKDFRELLVEYANASDGNVVYEFIDPNKDQQMEQQAMQAGIMPSIVNVRDKDQMTQKKVYLGAVLKLGEKKDIIPIVQPGTAMEYALSSGIKKLSITDKPLIGLVRGHGEASMAAMPQAMESLSVLYHVEEVDMDMPSSNLSKYTALAVVAPTDTVSPLHLAMLDGYLALGGKLFLALNRVVGDFRAIQGKSLHTGFEVWLSNKGLFLDNNFLVDANCGTIGVQQQTGRMNFTTRVNFPYLPLVKSFSDHPITKGLEEVRLQFASTINFNGDTALTYTPLAMSSNKSGIQTPPLTFDINKKWTERDFPLSGLTVAAVLSGPIQGDMNATIVLVSDGDFAVNGEGQRPQQQPADNVSLMVNSIDWLADETGLIELRTKAVTSRRLDPLDDGKKNLLKWLNFLLPIVLVILYGIIRSQRSRIIRLKRMEKGYV